MKKLSRVNLKKESLMSESEMKKIKAGWTCWRSGYNGSFSTDSYDVAYAWMNAWSGLGNDVKCYS